MKFLDTITRIFSGSINDAADKELSKNPGRTGRQIVRELDEQIQSVDASITNVRANKELHLAEKADADADVQKWDGYANQAAQKKNVDDARECLEKKKVAQLRSNGFAEQIAKIDPDLTALEKRLVSLQQQRDAYSNETDMLQARTEVAGATELAASTLAGVGAQNPGANFKALEASVMRREAHAQAVVGRSNELSGDDLETRMKNQTAAASVDDELTALMAKHA